MKVLGLLFNLFTLLRNVMTSLLWALCIYISIYIGWGSWLSFDYVEERKIPEIGYQSIDYLYDGPDPFSHVNK
jgi:TRAP-type C4-dicarboxylate transport system permease small subunit